MIMSPETQLRNHIEGLARAARENFDVYPSSHPRQPLRPPPPDVRYAL